MVGEVHPLGLLVTDDNDRVALLDGRIDGEAGDAVALERAGETSGAPIVGLRGRGKHDIGFIVFAGRWRARSTR